MDGPGPNANNGASRAEKFEDEKRRIIDSLFGKKDKDGSVLESYITHIRIVEDAAYPSSPPPPNSNTDAKKPRVIIVAVRKSGRVLIHKARENANGSFSIGKTWPLDDLTVLQSFSGSAPTTIEEEQQKQWAGGIGFIVTIGKPYYWQANTEKEKSFFIASLVKIYTKYTGGKSPELIGFDDRERSALAGSASRNPASLGQKQTASPSLPLPSSNGQGPGGPGRVRQPPSRDPMLRSPQSQDPMPRSPAPGSDMRSPPRSARGQMQPSRREDSPSKNFEYGGSPAHENQSSLRQPAVGNRSQDSFNREDLSIPPPRSRDGPSPLSRMHDPSFSGASQRSMTPDTTITGDKQKPPNDIPPVPAPLNILPERRRPPIQGLPEIPNRRARDFEDKLIPAPLNSPTLRREELDSTRTDDRPEMSNSETPEAAYETNDNSTSSNPRPLNTARSPESAIESAMSVVSPSDDTPSEAIDDRPGLGPMIRKKKSKVDVANTFRKAASAVNAFKPRVGGAAERLRELGLKSSTSEPDGITGVVPAPSLLRAQSSNSAETTNTINSSTTLTSSTAIGLSKETLVDQGAQDAIPEVKITIPPSEKALNQRVENKSPITAKNDKVEPVLETRETRRRKPTSERTQKELAVLGIDPILLDGRSTEFIALLDEFGWVGEGVHNRNIDEMREDIEREVNKAQAGGWLSRFEEEDERVTAISDGIDSVISEVEELDGLLTLYGVELGTLTEDVAYIEAQSQGLQVQAANQKLLQAEVQSLLETISISRDQLSSLEITPLDSPRGLEEVEAALVLLFNAMVTIDPSLSMTTARPSEDSNAPSNRGGFGDSEIGSMRVLQEKKSTYNKQSEDFLKRVEATINSTFGFSFSAARDTISRDSTLRRGLRGKIEPKNHEAVWKAAWKYSAIVLFAREVNPTRWEKFLRSYEFTAKPVIQEEFNNAMVAWKRTFRKPPPTDDTEYIFTSHVEKQAESLGRKLTVKATPSLGKLRSMGDLGSKNAADKNQDTRTKASEVFAIALEEMSSVIFMEQNFIIEFFHISSIEAHEFPDLVAAAPPEIRRSSDLRKPKPMDPNRELAKKAVQSMEEIYSSWPSDMHAMVLWAIEVDPTQGVGVLAVLERKLADLEETSQEYLTRTLQKLQQQLRSRFEKFLEDQIRAIEDTKVKIKKRKGVIAFIRVFPHFSLNIESMLTAAEDLEIRDTVNLAYRRIIKTMFDSLKVIARENPSATNTGASLADPEAKEALNYQILLIENMHHYIEEVDTRNNATLEEFRDEAQSELNAHLQVYIGAVIRRPLGKLLDILESTESRMESLSQDVPRSAIANNQSHSKSKFQNILAAYDGKEIRNGIDALKGRVQKHFTHPDDPNSSKQLVGKVLEACQGFYENIEKRITDVSTEVYEGDASFSWTRSDVMGAFKR